MIHFNCLQSNHSIVFFFFLLTKQQIDFSKASKDESWSPSKKVDGGTKKKRRTRRKRVKVAVPGFPKVNDLVSIDFGNDNFEAIVLEVTPDVIDIQYLIDGSAEYVKRADIVARNMALKKRPELGSKLHKSFMDTKTKKKRPFSGKVIRVNDKGEEGTLFLVKYEDGDEEEMKVETLLPLLD